MTSPVNKSLDEIAKEPSIPILAFTGTLLQEIRYITGKLSNSEYAVFLALRRIDKNHPHFLAYDFFMPEQKASGGGVSLDPKDCQRHFDGLKTHPYYKENGLHRHLCHLHSHAGMQVFWSATDDTQQLSRDDLGFMDDYRFYCVVNTKEEIKCSFVFYKPVLARVDAAVAVSFSGADHAEQLTRKRRQELDEMIDAAMSGYSAETSHVSEFGAAAGNAVEAASGTSRANSSSYGGNDARQGNFWGNGDNGRFALHSARAAAKYSRYSPGYGRQYGANDGWRDDYWDSFHDNYSGYGPEDCVPDDAVWDSGNWADPANQPIDLGWFAFIDNYKSVWKIPDTMLQAFLNSSNVDRKYAKRARKLLSWVMDQIFGLEVTQDTKDMYAAVTEEDFMTSGMLVGEYVLELMHTMRENNGFGDDWDEKQYISENTCRALRTGNKDRIIEAVMEDLTRAISEALDA